MGLLCSGVNVLWWYSTNNSAVIHPYKMDAILRLEPLATSSDSDLANRLKKYPEKYELIPNWRDIHNSTSVPDLRRKFENPHLLPSNNTLSKERPETNTSVSELRKKFDRRMGSGNFETIYRSTRQMQWKSVPDLVYQPENTIHDGHVCTEVCMGYLMTQNAWREHYEQIQQELAEHNFMVNQDIMNQQQSFVHDLRSCPFLWS